MATTELPNSGQGGLVQWVLDQTDSFLGNMSASVSDILSTLILPVVGAGLSVTLILYCWAIMRGVIEMPVQDFLHKILVITLVLSFAAAGGIYATDIIPLIQTVPTDLADRLVFPGSSPGGSSSLVSKMDIGFDSGMLQATTLIDFAFTVGTDVAAIAALLICAVLIGLATIIFTGVGLVLMMVVKVGLALMAAVGPIFILCLLFQNMKDMFAKWVAQILNFTILIVLFSILYAFLVKVMQFAFNTSTNRFISIGSNVNVDGSNLLWLAFGIFMLALSSIVVMMLLPGIASSLTGGAGFQAGKAIKNLLSRRDS